MLRALRFLPLTFCILSTVLLSDVATPVSLSELLCQRKPEVCDQEGRFRGTGTKFISDQPRHIPTDFSSWNDYGKTVPDGTGYGPGVGPLYHPGLGEVDVRTGVAVHHPVGNVLYRRDFELGFGGSGRIGGQPIGFGEGYGNNGDTSGLPGWPHPAPLLG
uniref:Glycine rich superfamily member n=1 Tax=Steinernema glaseri TaxID=37863 RepID=A0A1I8AKY4_9BILA